MWTSKLGQTLTWEKLGPWSEFFPLTRNKLSTHAKSVAIQIVNSQHTTSLENQDPDLNHSPRRHSWPPWCQIIANTKNGESRWNDLGIRISLTATIPDLAWHLKAYANSHGAWLIPLYFLALSKVSNQASPTIKFGKLIPITLEKKSKEELRRVYGQ